MASAILGNGDAVVIEDDLSMRLVHDGADPDDPPAEGELTTVDSVVVTPTGACSSARAASPSRGRGSRSTRRGAAISDVRFGHALALVAGRDPAGLGAAARGIAVTDLDGVVLASADLSASPRTASRRA